MRAIDLYAGVGGWSLGLKLAGIEVVKAYEWWSPAVATYKHNLGEAIECADVRTLKLSSLPSDIDLVVGSPPCTQFSFSNRGGSGDIGEGISDLVRFFAIVRHLKPAHWVMENVPRVATIVREGFATKGHPLYRFRTLAPHIYILDFSDLGLPQARKRCLIGTIPLDEIEALGQLQTQRTLKDAVSALGRKSQISDPIWNVSLPRRHLTEMEMEAALDAEQSRKNQEAKAFHPVYNDMAFPDRVDAPSRTVTATCTRVSRESIIIEDERQKGLRRLSIRERASLQGFPITYQFFGNSHSQKIKLIGNALPPPVSFLVGTIAAKRKGRRYEQVGQSLRLPVAQPAPTQPERRATTYPERRTFHAALPNLRLKSGVRFDLANRVTARRTQWTIRFFYGPSKQIQRVTPNAETLKVLRRSEVVRHALRDAQSALFNVERWLTRRTPHDLQLVWAHRKVGAGPYHLVDELGRAALILETSLTKGGARHLSTIEELVMTTLAVGGARSKFAKSRKVRENAGVILAGLILSSWFNSLDWHTSGRVR